MRVPTVTNHKIETFTDVKESVTENNVTLEVTTEIEEVKQEVPKPPTTKRGFAIISFHNTGDLPLIDISASSHNKNDGLLARRLEGLFVNKVTTPTPTPIAWKMQYLFVFDVDENGQLLAPDKQNVVIKPIFSGAYFKEKALPFIRTYGLDGEYTQRYYCARFDNPAVVFVNNTETVKEELKPVPVTPPVETIESLNRDIEALLAKKESINAEIASKGQEVKTVNAEIDALRAKMFKSKKEGVVKAIVDNTDAFIAMSSHVANYGCNENNYAEADKAMSGVFLKRNFGCPRCRLLHIKATGKMPDTFDLRTLSLDISNKPTPA